MTRDEAELLAVKALGWLASQEEVWPAFLLQSGVEVANLRQAAADPSFLAAVLEFLTQHDGWITAFCDAAGVDYHAPMSARNALSPGDMHWT